MLRHTKIEIIELFLHLLDLLHMVQDFLGLLPSFECQLLVHDLLLLLLGLGFEAEARETLEVALESTDHLLFLSELAFELLDEGPQLQLAVVVVADVGQAQPTRGCVHFLLVHLIVEERSRLAHVQVVRGGDLAWRHRAAPFLLAIAGLLRRGDTSIQIYVLLALSTEEVWTYHRRRVDGGILVRVSSILVSFLASFVRPALLPALRHQVPQSSG